MKKAKTILQILTVCLFIVALYACNPVEKQAQSASYLIVEKVLGYTADGTAAAFLESDVQEYDYVNDVPYVTSDVASITLQAALLDPDSVSGPSPFNDITLTGYKVTYTLPGGGGSPGVDVPMPIEGSLSSLLIQVGKSTTVPFAVVLNGAKLVAPLVALAGTANVLSAIAVIEFTGQDGIGKVINATGSLTIYFADYYDPPPDPAIKK